MTLNAKTYYEVACDEPGCGITTGDLNGDFSAWSDHGQAVTDWEEHDGQVRDGQYYCNRHRKPQCDECGKLVVVCDDSMCKDCCDGLCGDPEHRGGDA